MNESGLKMSGTGEGVRMGVDGRGWELGLVQPIVECSLINGKFSASSQWVRVHQIILKLRLSAYCEQPSAFEGYSTKQFFVGIQFL